MSYEVHLDRSAEKEIARFPDAVHSRIADKILSLENNPRPVGIKKLSGRDEYRVRVGDYRILFTIDDKNSVVHVSAVGHRREIYG